MKSPFIQILIALIAVGLVAAALSGSSPAASYGLQSAASASPAYIQSALPMVVVPAPVMPPQPLGTLPNSTLPTIGQICSAEASNPGSPPRCSTTAVGQRCSVQCGDPNGACSAIADAAGQVACSTLSERSLCSVLQPTVGNEDIAQCSTLGLDGGSNFCSTFRTGQRQFCSAENPGPRTQCSAFTRGVNVAGCSVFNPASGNRGICSAFFSGEKLCSTFSDGAKCSVANNRRGACTAFRMASPNNCSAFIGPGQCSIIGGPPAGPICSQP